jgi:hypothetical protein
MEPIEYQQDNESSLIEEEIEKELEDLWKDLEYSEDIDETGEQGILDFLEEREEATND